MSAFGLQVYIQPGASKSEVAGLHDGVIKIRIAAPAVENAANRLAGKIRTNPVMAVVGPGGCNPDLASVMIGSPYQSMSYRAKMTPVAGQLCTTVPYLL
jgi:uncharacterized membrane protein